MAKVPAWLSLASLIPETALEHTLGLWLVKQHEVKRVVSQNRDVCAWYGVQGGNVADRPPLEL